MRQPYNPATTAAPISMRGIPIEHLIGFRLTCEKCERPFRCYRADETHCGCCRQG